MPDPLIPSTTPDGPPFATSSFFQGFAVSPQRIQNLSAAIDAANAAAAGAGDALAGANSAAASATASALSASNAASAAVTTVNAAVATATGTINDAANTALASVNASASAAATSASNAATSASGASTSATNAATSADTATTRATTAGASATSASGSASAAASSATAAAGSATTATTQASAATASALSAAASATATVGFRNAVMNGDFRIWQRGLSFSGSPSIGYGPDRWSTSWDGTGALTTLSKASVTDATVLGDGCENALRYQVTLAGSGATFRQLVQPIENPRTFAGQTVTLSFWAKAASALTLGYFLSVAPGTGGSPAGHYDTGSGAASVTTAWQRFSTTWTLNAASTITPGTNLDGSLKVAFNLPLNALVDLSITGIQLSPGTAASSFERRPIGVELGLCQRFYLGAANTAGFYAGAAGASMFIPTFFPVTMRAAPTCVVTASGGANYSSVGSFGPTTTGVALNPTGVGIGNVSFGYVLTATAEL